MSGPEALVRLDARRPRTRPKSARRESRPERESYLMTPQAIRPPALPAGSVL